MKVRLVFVVEYYVFVLYCIVMMAVKGRGGGLSPHTRLNPSVYISLAFRIETMLGKGLYRVENG